MNYTIQNISGSDLMINTSLNPAVSHLIPSNDVCEVFYCECFVSQMGVSNIKAAISNGLMIVNLNGNPLSESESYRLINEANNALFNGVKPSDKYLSEDYLEYELIETYEIVDPALKEIEKTYPKKRRDGKKFVKVESLKIIKNIKEKVYIPSGTKDENSAAAKLVENKVKEAFRLIKQDGYWKSAYAELSLQQVESYFTQELKDYYLSVINDYITENY